MFDKIKSVVRPLVAAVGLALCAFAPTAVAQPKLYVTNWDQVMPITVPGTIVAGGTSNLTSQPVLIHPGYGVGLEYVSSSTNATTTSNLTFKINVSKDRTNFQTTAPFSLVKPMTGSTTNRFWTNYPASILDSMGWIQVDSIQNGDTVNAVDFAGGVIYLIRAKMLDPNKP